MKSKKNIIILMLVIAISLFGITYAFFDYYKLGVNQEIISGRVSLTLNEGTDTINISNVFPETAEKARARTDNFITFTITGHNTTLDNDIYYEIMLNEGPEIAGRTRFNPYDICFDLVEIDSSGNRTYVFEQTSFEDFDARRIWVNTVNRETEADLSRTYELRMWLSEDVKVSDTNPSSDYPATGFANYYANVRVSVFGDFQEKEISYQPNYLARENDMQFWPSEFMSSVQMVSEVKFVAMGQTEMETRYNAASVKMDVTASEESTVQETSAKQLSTKAQIMENTKGGKVYAWLEADTNNEGMSIMYIVSDGITYFPSDCSLMFSGFMNSTKFTFENINTSEVTDMGGMFYYCFNVLELDLRKFDTSNVTSFTAITVDPNGNNYYMGMFGLCTSLTKIKMTGWDTSKATNMSNMFGGCGSLTSLDVSHFDTSNVTDMSKMFSECSLLTRLNLQNFNTSQVTNMSSMFYYCKELVSLNINDWDTSSVLNMSGMFDECRSLTSLNVSHFNTSKVTDMSIMFRGMKSLSFLDVSNFDTSQVTDMSAMFGVSTDIDGGGLGITSLDVSNFDTSNVINMSYLFSGCNDVKVLEVENWDTSKVTNMTNLFAGTKVTTLDLSNWNTASVTDMSLMFNNCASLESLNLSSFDVNNVTNMSAMFDGCISLENLNIIKFSFNNVECVNIFRNMSASAKLTVGSKDVQDYILALDSSSSLNNSRPDEWTTENIIIGS